MEAPKGGDSPPLQNTHLADGTDVRKLCLAIARHETRNCTDTIAPNNCVNIMTWERGYREGKSYTDPESSIQDCMALWAKHYKRFPDYALADKYTGGDNVYGWLATVKQAYAE